MTPTKIADPLLPEQIAELRAKFIAAHDGPAWQFPALWEEFQTALAPLLGKLLSAAERGIAAGEEVERLRAENDALRAEIAHVELVYSESGARDAYNHLKEKAEADLAASNARIGECEALMKNLREDCQILLDHWKMPQPSVPRIDRTMRAIDALLTPTHPETERG